MCECVYVCMCVCVYVCECVCVSVCVCVCVHAYLHACMQVNMCIYLLHRAISRDLLIKHSNVTLQTLKIVLSDLIYICIIHTCNCT